MNKLKYLLTLLIFSLMPISQAIVFAKSESLILNPKEDPLHTQTSTSSVEDILNKNFLSNTGSEINIQEQ